MGFRIVFTVKKELSEKDFLRALLIELGTRENTPPDVVEATFGKVTEGMREVILCKAHVDGICTASVGYDRQETYYEKIKDSSGNYKEVKKTRTVTDWHPFSQKYSGTAICAAFNDSAGMANDNILVAIETARKESCVPGGTAEVCAEGLDKAHDLCRKKVTDATSIDFPGNRKKDESYRSSSSTLWTDCYKLPTYEVTYVYKGQEYQAYGFACGTPRANCEVLPETSDVKQALEEKTGVLKQRKKQSWWILGGVFLLSCILMALQWPKGAVIVLAAMAYTAYSNIIYAKQFNKCLAQLSKDMSATKLSMLQHALEKYGYQALSDDEKDIAEHNAECSIEQAEIPWTAIAICGGLSLIWVMVAGL